VAAGVVALVYLAFGAWALVASGGESFFVMFIVQGGLLAIAGFRGRQPNN
jgi:hypothetical protein